MEEPLVTTLDTANLARLADGIELLGELKDSGFAQPQSLIRRADGQVIQLSRLLYMVACLLDGTRGAEDIAAAVSADLGRTLTADQVRYLVSAKLVPLGIVAGQGAATAPTASPLLALRARVTLLPEAAACAAGTFLRPLFRLPVIAAVIVSVVALDFWIFTTHGLAPALSQLLNDPVDLLLVAGLSVVSALFHECGHAAGCRYGGARPGRIGAGLYLVWPSFFTNVTDSYRLSRAGRLRTDLGGLYFNMIFMLVLAACYTATRAEILLLVIAVTHLEMLEQLLPFVRFDGYFILSDLVGVPDLFNRVAPVLRGCLDWWPGVGRRLRGSSRAAGPGDHPGSGKHTDPRATSLRRGARIVITVWVLCVIPMLVLMLGFLVLHLPEVNRALWQSASHAARLGGGALAGHRYAEAAADGLGLALALLSIAGMLYVVWGLVRRAFAFGRRWSAGRPRRRLLVVIAGVVCAVPVSLFWLVQGQFSDW
jgi:putative peptide zinc metalloprotease protein